MNSSKVYGSTLLIFLIAAITIPTFAQNKTDSSANGNDFFNQWLNYSRPGAHHQLLASLVGNWSFTGEHFSGNANPDSNKVEVRFSGHLERKSFANGRYFLVESDGEKIDMPIQDGRSKAVMAKEIETEGYDNIKGKFIKTRIGNHLGSGISYSEGDYDSTTRTITYFRIETLTPEVSMKTYERLHFIDRNHYRIEIRRERENTIIKDTAMDFTRRKDK